jgi:cell division protease FtsH
MDEQPDNKVPPPQTPSPRQGPSGSTLWIVFIFGAVILFLVLNGRESKQSQITYGFFRGELDSGNIEKVNIQGVEVDGEFKEPPIDPEAAEKAKGQDSEEEPPRLKKKFITTFPSYILSDRELDEILVKKLGPNYKVTPEKDTTGLVLAVYLLVTVALFVGVWFLFRRARDSFGGGLMSGFSKSPARRYDAASQRVTFDDVAGLEGVKNDLQEVVEYLKNPEKFQRLGGRVPKGLLLIGPPGTGKTLLGRAIAGEAGVPFFSINGSEFIQMFVGVGASRVRDLFNTAKESSPSILFIDEIDAVGRHRGTGLGGGHDEREQTLNQILSEMDGFLQTESVIVVAATNRPDVLDPALLRPGRFDRHITVDRPTLKGRLAIFDVHSKDVPLDADVDLERLAASTVGMTGADIRNLVNEAALWASRHDKNHVDMSDFEYARDKVIMGSKREEILTDKEKSMAAYHESGHALLGWLVPGMGRVHKISIIPRGRSLGVTQLMIEEDRVSMNETEVRAQLLFLLGGRAAEKLVFDEYTAGAADDLNKATQLARHMVTHWGMSERLGPAAFHDGEDHPFLGKEMAEPRRFSEHTAQIIDEEIMKILRAASDRANEILVEYRDNLDALAKALETEETLDESEIEDLIGFPSEGTNAKSDEKSGGDSNGDSNKTSDEPAAKKDE